MRACPQCGSRYEDSTSYCANDGTQITLSDSVVEAGPKGAKELGQVLGTYRLLEVLGEGGMGRVFLAEHTRLGRKVALKRLRAEFALDPSAVQRFFQEARAVNQINHENIVEITDFSEGTGGEPSHYIMELLRGETLSDAARRAGGYLPPSRLVPIALQIAGALSTVHKAGIVHRDLKPDNVFLIDRGGTKDFVKLLDFGVAKLQGFDRERTALTATGAVIGTPEFMSPEQINGDPVDVRTDIYALGVILYYGLTGIKPVTGRTLGEIVRRHLEPATTISRVKDLPQSVSKPLEDLVMRCLAKKPEQRFQTMDDVIAKLRSFPAQVDRGPAPKSSGASVRFLAGAAIGVVVLGAGALGLRQLGVFSNEAGDRHQDIVATPTALIAPATPVLPPVTLVPIATPAPTLAIAAPTATLRKKATPVPKATPKIVPTPTAKAVATPAPSPAPTKKPVDKGGTMDPFGD